VPKIIALMARLAARAWRSSVRRERRAGGRNRPRTAGGVLSGMRGRSHIGQCSVLTGRVLVFAVNRSFLATAVSQFLTVMHNLG
jgi:hypothetical protein